jgi:alkylated DNA repair dioxygenase AlkB
MKRERIELQEEAWVDYYEDFYSPDKALENFENLRDQLDWEHRDIKVFGKAVKQPRLVAWAGDIEYHYSGQTLPIYAMHPLLSQIQTQVEHATGEYFNHVLLNYYRDGRDNMGMHADDERELGLNPVIAALSFGVDRRFFLKRKKSKKGETPTSILLQGGSLIVMGGTIQHTWRHGIPKAGRLDLGRINLTFRNLKWAPGTRPRD